MLILFDEVGNGVRGGVVGVGVVGVGLWGDVVDVLEG